MKALKANLQKNAEIMDLEKLQKRVEENEKEIQTKMWVDISYTTEKRTVEEAIEKPLKDRDSEGRDRQNRRKNIILGLPESKKK